ncbi:MAG TPA: hypothetical protein VGU73_11435 [Acidimicrobiia bacterium]|nr:hypothetical protein [Acidimicrobiia bacterium]
MIAVYIHPESLTKAQYDQIAAKLQAAGGPPPGLKHHSCFGEDGKLMIYDVWNSQGEWDAAWARLSPLFAEAGVSGADPATMPVVDVVQP